MTVTTDDGPTRDRPPLRLRVLGQALSQAIARAPALWPVLRGPTQRFWERSALSWDDRIKPDRSDHLAPLSAACERLEVEPRSILELGTGTGAGAIMLARRYPQAQVRAIDLSATMVEAARTKIPGELAERIEVEVGDAASLPDANETFDLVAQLNLPIYLEQAARVLRPGGYLIVGSSLGSSTPYYTPDVMLRQRCREHGLDPIAAAKANGGSYFLARRSDIQQADPTTGRVRRYYDRSASKYDRQIKLFERILFGDGRQWVCSQASGDVLEIAIGTGRNLRYYPDDVRVTGIELSPEMLELARREVLAIGRDADLRVGDAQKLEFPDESFDTVTCTLSLCTIPGDRAAVREARRVLRPGGRLVLMEHVRSPSRVIRIGQRLLEPLSLRFEHDHLTRDPLDYLEAEEFEVETVNRLKWGVVERTVVRKPTSTDAHMP